MPPAWVIEGLEEHGSLLSSESGNAPSGSNLATKAAATTTKGGSDDEKTVLTADESIFSLSLVDDEESSTSSALTDGGSSDACDHDDGIVSPNDDETAKVRFDLSKTETRPVRGRHEMNQEDYKDVWYVRSDFNKIASWNRMTVKLFRQHATSSDNDENDSSLFLTASQLGTTADLQDGNDNVHCIRGLEHRLKGQGAKRTEQKINAIYSVLGEQAKIKRSGKQGKDPTKKIAAVYGEHTYSHVTEAVHRGSQDQRVAQDIHAGKDTAIANASTGESTGKKENRRRSGISMSFDDCDFNALVEEEEEQQQQFRHNQSNGGSSSKRGGKSKRERRGTSGGGGSLARFFGRVKKTIRSNSDSSSSTTSGGSKDSSKDNTTKQGQSRPMVRQRRCSRRSSM